MRRSNSLGRPVRSACTGASKPSAAAVFGTSCTWPSVIRTTPASRSGGVSVSALLSSANSCVPWPVVSPLLAAVTHFTCKLGILESLASRSALMARVCSGRRSSAWLVLSSMTTMAMLARLSRSSSLSVGLARAASSAATARALAAAPRLRRNASIATRTRATRPAPQNNGPGSIGAKSIDQLMRRPSLTEALEERGDVHLIGFVVAGQRVHHDVDAGAKRHLALVLAADDRVHRPAGAVERPSGGKVVGRDQDRGHAVGAPRLAGILAGV